MNTEIYELTEQLKAQLGTPNSETVTFTSHQIMYKDVKYEVTFYKATTNEGVSYFWVCNPFHIVRIVSNEIPGVSA